MHKDDTLNQKIHQANIAVHKFEAKYYEALHPEVYSKKEQKRITTQLNSIDALIANNHKHALDFGAGTGNLTGKLLKIGYAVTAVDISPDMCTILKNKYAEEIQQGTLTVINAPIENLTFSKAQFDLITCYSVLHHLPDYLSALQTLSVFLKQGGVMYIDHEASPYYWKNEPTSLASFVKDIYFHSNPVINSLYFQIIGLKVPTIDYTLSDYWHKKEHPINHQKIQQTLKAEGFAQVKRVDYYQTSTWLPNPLALTYRLLCTPEMSYYLAKK